MVRNEPVRKISLWLLDQVKPFMKFGLVGLVALLVDIGLFNAIRQLEGPVGEDSFLPLIAKVCSVSVSTIVAWLGNRWWTFRSTRRKRFLLELVEYALVALGGMAIAVGCLWISHYVLGFTSVLADNISANVIGLMLATAFRFLLNRYWVFHGGRSHHSVKSA